MSCTAKPSATTSHAPSPNEDVPNPVLDSAYLEKHGEVPTGFKVAEREATTEELREPVVDLACLSNGDEEGVRAAAELVARAGPAHGFFQVVNHGVDQKLIDRAFECYEAFFKLPPAQKMLARRPRNGRYGYSAAHAERFTSSLPWKETLSFPFTDDASQSVLDYFTQTLGESFKEHGMVHQKYCEAMIGVCMKVMEVLAISLGVERDQYKEFFEGSHSIMRGNYYPICPDPEAALGTWAHCDPISITILCQDAVAGLEVFHNHRWNSVAPLSGALVVNIGDTFTALSNGKYKSCLHRAVVNKEHARKSMAFFLCPKEDKVVKPPQSLVLEQGSRKYPDFTWSDMLRFSNNQNRSDEDTLQNLSKWLLLHSSSKS